MVSKILADCIGGFWVDCPALPRRYPNPLLDIKYDKTGHISGSSMDHFVLLLVSLRCQHTVALPPFLDIWKYLVAAVLGISKASQ